MTEEPWSSRLDRSHVEQKDLGTIIVLSKISKRCCQSLIKVPNNCAMLLIFLKMVCCVAWVKTICAEKVCWLNPIAKNKIKLLPGDRVCIEQGPNGSLKQPVRHNNLVCCCCAFVTLFVIEGCQATEKFDISLKLKNVRDIDWYFFRRNYSICFASGSLI